MVEGIDREVLEGFLEEARGYLPVIFQGVDEHISGEKESEVLESAHRYCHTIKGAAAMIGLGGLSEIAYYLEELFQEMIEDHLTLDGDQPEQLRQLILQVEIYLDSLANDNLFEDPLLDKALNLYHEIQGMETRPPEHLNEEGDGIPKLEEQDDPEVVPTSIKSEPQVAEIAPELLEVFSIEAEDHMRAISTGLADLDRTPEDKEVLQEVRRRVHTLKGAAGSLGLNLISQLSHRMEDLLDLLYEGSKQIDQEVMQLLFESSDALEDLTRGESSESKLKEALADLYARYNKQFEGELKAGQIPELEVIAESPLFHFQTQQTTDESSDDKVRVVSAIPRVQADVIRVPLERLDELVRLVSELVISRSAFEQRMSEFTREVDELQLSNDRLQRVSKTLDTKYEASALGGRLELFGGRSRSGGNGDFDALQMDRYTEFHLLTRELVEVASDLRTIGFELTHMIGDFDSLVNRQGRLSTQVQDKLMRTRMVPLATIATRLHRAVRVLAQEQGKVVDLLLEGDEVEIDTTVLDAIVDPLLHLMRNAVDHGLETPDERLQRGKSERGQIRLRAYYEGSQVVIQVRDDGHGLDQQRILTTALERELTAEPESGELSHAEIQALIFSPGFSTATEVSEVSGRGVGLDIVRTNVDKLNGTVSVESQPGRGTTFTIRLPMTLAVIHALLVSANHETFALPLSAVSQILRLKRSEVERIGSESVVRLNDVVYPLHHLSELLQLSQPADESLDYLPVLILNTGEEQIALMVDQLLTGREIVIKSMGSHLRRVQGIMGATLMGDGKVVLILNPAELVMEAPSIGSAHHLSDSIQQIDRLQVMVVDDSLSVRRVVSNLLRNAGWEPIAAKDGLDALEILQGSARLPDLILVDIEMPRMDGYEFMSTLKSHPLYKHIPMVVLSSRAGEKHREKAMESGASDYLVKPYQDEIMLGTIRRWVKNAMGVLPA